MKPESKNNLLSTIGLQCAATGTTTLKSGENATGYDSEWRMTPNNNNVDLIKVILAVVKATSLVCNLEQSAQDILLEIVKSMAGNRSGHIDDLYREKSELFEAVQRWSVDTIHKTKYG